MFYVNIDPGACIDAERLDMRSLRRQIARLWCRALPGTRQSYRPERHYMRGPGPRWREAQHNADDHTTIAASDAEPGSHDMRGLSANGKRR
jgi:hypothetical protein